MDAVDRRRKKIKAQLIELHGGECVVCGYSKCHRALQFHHMDPEKKDFSLSSKNVMNFDKAVKEAKKCLLVCGNCHVEIHEGLIDASEYYMGV